MAPAAGTRIGPDEITAQVGGRDGRDLSDLTRAGDPPHKLLEASHYFVDGYAAPIYNDCVARNVRFLMIKPWTHRVSKRRRTFSDWTEGVKRLFPVN